MLPIMIAKGLVSGVLASLRFERGLTGGELIRDFFHILAATRVLMTALLVPLMNNPAGKGPAQMAGRNRNRTDGQAFRSNRKIESSRRALPPCETANCLRARPPRRRVWLQSAPPA